MCFFFLNFNILNFRKFENYVKKTTFFHNHKLNEQFSKNAIIFRLCKLN